MFDFNYMSHHALYFVPIFPIWYNFLQEKNIKLLILFLLSLMGLGPLLIKNWAELSRLLFLLGYGLGWAMFSVGQSYLLYSPHLGFISSGWPLMWLRFCLNKTFRHFKPINCVSSSYGCRWFYELSCSELYQTGYKPICNQTLFLISRSCHDLGRYYILLNDNYTLVWCTFNSHNMQCT